MNNYNIAFYLPMNNVRSDMRNADLDEGNPGLGGTQYLFLLTVKHLNREYGNHHALLLTNEDFCLNDSEVPFETANSEKEAIKYCEAHKIEVLTINANAIDAVDKSIFDTNVRIFIWAHNTLTWKRQLLASQINSIERVICVSEKQYLNMADTPCQNKCTYINNIIPEKFYEKATLTDYSTPSAVYIASIMPQKGVHNLLSVWKHVEKVLPESNLYIFGGSNIWNQNKKLGDIGVADIYYERIIRRKLKKLKHSENVHFMGAKGWGEIDLLIKTARVGIVNPSYYLRDETFCMSAVEMEAHGIPVVSRMRSDGLLTTIKNGYSGYLEKKDQKIADRIIEMLQNSENSKQIGMQARAFAEQFLVHKEINKWDEMIKNPLMTSGKVTKHIRKSKDGKLLDHDFFLKLLFTVSSGKIFYLIKKKLHHS
ncbi:MAG: glycosyltransferase family 4 protein [Acutalibacteraceae bacterium]